MELQTIQNKIYEIRGLRVMLDFDLAELYQVPTKALKQAVKRNIERFEGDDFMFELSESEYNALKDRLRSQIVTLEIDGRGKYPKFSPVAFTVVGGGSDACRRLTQPRSHTNQSSHYARICPNAQLSYADFTNYGSI